MAYSLLPDDASVEAAMHRIAKDQLDRARKALDATGDSLHPAVHEARKRLKKVRALARLMRGAFPGYGDANRKLRDAARLMSDFRDRTAVIETLDRVGDRGGRPGQEAAHPLREALVGARWAALDADGFASRLDEFRDRLDALREAVRDWRLDADGWSAIGPGVAKTYGRARKAGKAARKDPSPEAIHDWRKRMKYHWYQARLLRQIWPEAMAVRIDALCRVTDLLGESHDLAVLRPHLEDAAIDPEARDLLERLARNRAKEAEAEAMRLGARLLADRPSALAERWKRLWAIVFAN